jgi:predicted permease
VPTDFWLPFSSPAMAQRFADRTAKYLWLGLMARLKPNVSAAQAASAMSTLFASSVTNGPEAIFKPDDAPRIKLPTAVHGLATLRQGFSRPLFALLAGVAIVLLIACANIAGLLLARSAARRKEIAMRTALGATRGRVIRQLLTESLLLSVAGGTAGILLGWWGAQALTAFLGRNWYMPMQVDVHPDPHVLAFTVLVSVLVGMTVGLTPALSTGRKDLVAVLKEGLAGSVGATHGRRITLGDVLVVVQIALTLLVLVGAGLFARTLANLKALNPGFDPQNLLVFGVDATYSSRAGGNLKVLHRELDEQLKMLPGVTSISYSALPLLAGAGMSGPIFPEDQPNSPIQVELLPIAPDFFKTMQIPLLAGRTLNAQDSEDKPSDNVHRYQPMVINKKLAHRLFGERNPIGRYFRAGPPGSPLIEVVGVVDDAKYDNMRDTVMPTIYAAIGDDAVTFEIRTAMDPKNLMPFVRAAVSRFDSHLLITDMKTQMEQIDQNIYPERLIANLSSLFALLALIVACVGIYGLLSYQVSRRTHEIGIRLASGAQRGDVLRLVMRQGAVLAVLGALIGIAAALAVTRYLQSFLFGVKPSDPATIVAVAFGLIAVALLASYIPARRAMKTDPMVALRYE